MFTIAKTEAARGIWSAFKEPLNEPGRGMVMVDVIAAGICACSGGIFAECYNVMGGIDKVIPVDVYVQGCAVRPEAIIDGVVKALAILEERHARAKAA
jgi:Ni,Fe-hydrogenase III small subunit